MTFRLATLLLTSSVFVLAACDDDDDDNGTGPAQTALIRVVNASGTASVDVLNGTTSVTTALAQNTGSTSCFTVPAGSATLAFRAAGGTTNLASATATLTADQRYTLVLTGTGATSAATLLTDNTTDPGTGNNGIRLVNATATAGDVHITTPTGTLGTPTSAALAAGAATTTFATVPTANTRIRLFNTGTTTGTPRADFTLPTLTGNRLATVVLANPGTATFVVAPCP